MRVTNRQRRLFNFVLAAALVLGQFAGFLTLPKVAEAALSADPNAEIVYIDNNDFIRVLDLQGSPQVAFVSPDGGWDQIVLMDAQADGDLEILALDAQGESTVRVALFDPVLARGATDPNKQFNGIPWDLLWTITFPGNGQYVVGGDFDANIPGDEIAIGWRNGDNSVVQIWNANSLDPVTQKPTGRDWKAHIIKEYPAIEYTYGIPGQLNGEGPDELILMDPESDVTRMDIYRTDLDMLLTDSETSDNVRFKQAVAGQLIEDGQEELAASVSSTGGSSRTTLRTYIMGNDGEIEEDAVWEFTPTPDWVFFADIRGNGDKEILFLRENQEGKDFTRLIMRDDWGDDQRQNDALIEWSLMDDGANNEFRAAAGGDVDGDGRDEIILLRDDRIRVYPTPETGNEDTFEDHLLATDNRRLNLLVGDLDRNGFTTGPILTFSTSLVDAILPAGSVSQQYNVSVQNIGTNGAVGIAARFAPPTSWVRVNPTFATTPATFRVQFDATNLAPGTYNTTMIMDANAENVQNDNFQVLLRLTVVPPVLEPSPPILNFYRLPCEPSPCSADEIAERSEPFTTTIEIGGSADLAFRAAVLGVPEEPTAATLASVGGLAGPITAGDVDDNGNIIIYDDFGNSRTLEAQQVSAAAVTSGTVVSDPLLTWITPTLDSNVVPATLSLHINPSVVGTELQREYAVVVLVADIRSGPPSGNVVMVPVQVANVGGLMYLSKLSK